MTEEEIDRKIALEVQIATAAGRLNALDQMIAELQRLRDAERRILDDLNAMRPADATTDAAADIEDTTVFQLHEKGLLPEAIAKLIGKRARSEPMRNSRGKLFPSSAAR